MEKETFDQLDRLLASYFGPLKRTVRDGRIDVAKLPAPQVTVTVPDVVVPPFPEIPKIEVPPIVVPTPQVTVNVDEVEIKNWPTFPTPERFDDARILAALKKLFEKTSGGGGGSGTTTFYDTATSKYVDVSSTNPLPVSAAITIDASDIQIGAVELKNGSDDTRGTISTVGATTILHTGIFKSDGTQIDTFGGGTQYDEGDTDATITGTAALVEGAANALAVLTQPLTDTQLRAADVKITLDGETVPVTGTFWQATQPVSGTVTANAGTNLNTSALALETGGNLAAIKAKTDNIPAQGQALAAASLPVVLTAAQITTLTPPAAITGFATETTLAAIDAGKLEEATFTGRVGEVQATPTANTILARLKTIADNQLADSHNVTVDNASLAVTGTFWQATQPVSIASVPSHEVTNAGTFATQAAITPLTSCGSGVTTVTTAGTQVALGASTAIDSVTIKAHSTNTGLIYVGASAVSSADGFQLSAGDSVSLDIDNLTDVFVDSAVNGESVSYIWVT